MASAKLTPQETSVLRLVANGGTAKHIAIELGIAPRTVEKHIDHARLKLRAKNRAHLATLALQTGILGGPHRAPETQQRVEPLEPVIVWSNLYIEFARPRRALLAQI
jgi:DNA-binding CsgD family transcriptional regulator